MSPEALGEHAQRLIDDPVLAQAFDDVRDAAVTAWTQTKADDVQAREVAWLTVKVIDRVRGELQGMVDSGKIAARRVQAPIR